MLSSLAHRHYVFVVCAIGLFTTVFDTSSAIVALPTIAIDFETTLPIAQWVIVGNTLTIAALLVPMGRLSDLIGRKRIYVVGCLLFGLGALAAALSYSIATLITSRIFVGIGSAMTQATAMAMLVGNFGVTDRAKVMGMQMAGVGLGAMAGPGIGGIIVGSIGWRMLFFLTAAAMLVTAIVAQRVLRRRKKRPDVETVPFDLIGAVLFSSLLAAGLLTLTLGPGAGWNDPATLAGLALFALLAISFVIVEKRQPAPMLDFALFKNGAFALGALAAVVTFMCISSMRFLTPFFLQGVKGLGPSQIGLLMLPAAMTTTVVAPFAGRWADRFGVRLVANIGFSLAVLGLILFSTLNVTSPTWVLVLALIVMGLGVSSFSAPNAVSILNSFGADSHGLATGFANLCRNTGNVLGIAFATAVVTLTMSRAGFAPSLAEVEVGATDGLLPAFARGVQVSSLALVSAAVPVLALIVIWTIRRMPPST